ncbi:MAG: NAD-dependent epimerase/dehydratase family protein [Acidimicrobiales bacterium]
MAPTALLIGGTGPTGPLIAAGLEARGHEVTLFHSGRHEVDDVVHLRHLHGDAYDRNSLVDVLADETFDVVVASYGRLRVIAELLAGRVGRFLSIGGVPVYKGYFDPDAHEPAGLPVPTAEDAVLATEDDDGKSYRIGRTEEIVFEHHPTATHFRYPFVYGPRQLVPREWCIVRRILDGRPFLILPDDGLSLVTFGYVDNLSHALLLAVDRPEASRGEIFNCGDEECLSLRQVAELLTDELGHEWELIGMPSALATPARPLMMNHRTTHRVMDLAKLRDLLGYRDVVPAREAIRRTGRWLAAHPPAAGGEEEAVLEDPFDYAAEDRLVAWWRTATADPPDLGYTTEPGYGLAYGGPGATRVRSDDRI